jgi:hypothetical protein
MYTLFQLHLTASITKVQENQEELEMNGTHQLLANSDDGNLLSININTRNKKKLYQVIEKE